MISPPRFLGLATAGAALLLAGTFGEPARASSVIDCMIGDRPCAARSNEPKGVTLAQTSRDRGRVDDREPPRRGDKNRRGKDKDGDPDLDREEYKGNAMSYEREMERQNRMAEQRRAEENRAFEREMQMQNKLEEQRRRQQR